MAAALYAEKQNIPVDLRVTIDPVDGLAGGVRAGFRWLNSVNSENITRLRENLGGPWVNVRGTRYETIHPGENDWVASLGGRMSAADQSQADISLELNVDHSAFGAMMKVAKIPEMISGIYGNWKSQ